MMRMRTACSTDSGKAFSLAKGAAGCLVLLFALCLALAPASLHAAKKAAPSDGIAMPETLGARSDRNLSADKAAGKSEAPAAAVDYKALDASATSSDPEVPTDAEKKDGAVPGPAEKAAERAREFRLSQQPEGVAAGEETKGETINLDEISSDEDVLESSIEVSEPLAPSGPLTFSQCVHLALRQSPYLVQTAMEVQLRRIDESDSWWNMLPKLKLSTSYLLIDAAENRRREPLTNEERWDLDFAIAPWDPLEAGLSVMATQEITKVAILAHMRVISDGLMKLGELFITLGHIDELIVVQDELIALSEHQKTFLSNLIDSGSANPLELRIAEQEVEMAVLEREQMLAKRDEMKLNLKSFLGLEENDPLELDLADASNQVHGYFSPSEVSVEEVKTNSIMLQIEEQKRKLQEYKIGLAWAQYIPRLKFGFRTPDVVDSDKENDGFYTTIGFDWLFWDWGERYRNVRRERLETRRAIAQENITGMNVVTSWQTTLSQKRSSLAALKVSRAMVELAGLRKRQGEISYQAGTQAFPQYLKTIKDYFEARKRSLKMEMEDDIVLLKLRYISGDLFNAYVTAKNL